MPAVAPSMTEGNIVRWAKKQGDTVKQGEILLELETDKAVVEVEAQQDGVLGAILVPEGTNGVKVDTVIALLAAKGEDPATLAVAAGGAEAARAARSPAPPPGPAPPTKTSRTRTRAASSRSASPKPSARSRISTSPSIATSMRCSPRASRRTR